MPKTYALLKKGEDKSVFLDYGGWTKLQVNKICVIKLNDKIEDCGKVSAKQIRHLLTAC